MWPWEITANETGAAWATAYLTGVAIVASTIIAVMVPALDRRARRAEMALGAAAALLDAARTVGWLVTVATVVVESPPAEVDEVALPALDAANAVLASIPVHDLPNPRAIEILLGARRKLSFGRGILASQPLTAGKVQAMRGLRRQMFDDYASMIAAAKLSGVETKAQAEARLDAEDKDNADIIADH